MKGKKEIKSKKEEKENKENLTKDDLEKEIQKYLKTNQEILEADELEPEDIKELNGKNEERQNEFKKIVQEKNLDDLMKICLSAVNKIN
jgi:hypothetical protein